MADSVSNADLQERFAKLYQKTCSLGLTGKELDQLSSLQLFNTHKGKPKWRNLSKFLITTLSVLCVIPVVGLSVWFLNWPVSSYTVLEMWMNSCDADVKETECLVELSEFMLQSVRPPVSCDYCQGLKEVPRVRAISNAEFAAKYAYSSIPVLVENAMEGFTATETFNFSFFKSLYVDEKSMRGKMCQFFPYKTNFNTLAEVFNMSEERANLEDGTEPWYIGWSNCNSSIASVLRKHYKRPYFLPDDAESSSFDWIFMGSPGYGTPMHVDRVYYTSWQAQVTGTKMWILEPPPECYFQCARQLKVVMNPGDVIVVDTSNWYHATLIMGTNISITIGSEYTQDTS